MAEIRAFKGTFYDTGVVGDLSTVTSPPYDVINARRRKELQAKSPYNVVRLILPQDESDREFWNTSRELFREWKSGGVFKADQAPALYVYRQTFEIPKHGRTYRTGITAALRCKNFSHGDVLPHEKTFPKVSEERLNLLRSCRANFSQIFTVFRDPQGEVLQCIEKTVAEPAFVEFSDEEGVMHQLWRIEESDATDMVVKAISKQKLIIADGHHRYETAFNFSLEGQQAEADQPRGYVSTTLFRSEDPGLVILPVHRLIRRLPLSVEEALARLERFFDVREMGDVVGFGEGGFQEKLAGSERPGFIMIAPRTVALLRLREGVDPDKAIKGSGSAAWKGQDVAILHALVIEESLGMDADRLAEEGDLYFSPWEREVLTRIERGEAEAAFMLRPVRIDEVWRIAEGGERMPHKSTYFHPKLPSGLIIYDHENAFDA